MYVRDGVFFQKNILYGSGAFFPCKTIDRLGYLNNLRTAAHEKTNGFFFGLLHILLNYYNSSRGTAAHVFHHRLKASPRRRLITF